MSEVRIVVTSEDGSDGAVEALGQLVISALKTERIPVQSQQISRVGLREKRLREALTGDKWRAAKPTPARTDALQALARELLSPSVAAVVMHVDADATWSISRGTAKARDIERHIREPLRRLTAGSQADALSRLVIWLPHWDIEAWTYQNTQTAARLAREHRLLTPNNETLVAWETNRGALDELERPSATCALEKKFNVELTASGWPWEPVSKAEKSFHAAATQLRAVPRLRLALGWPPAPSG